MVMILMRTIKAVIKQRKNTVELLVILTGKECKKIYSKNVNYRTR